MFFCPLLDEFRGAVCAGQLTCLFQYNDYCFYPDIPARMQQITAAVGKFYTEKVAPCLPYTHCIIDFCVRNGSVCIIEINPFGAGTGIPFGAWTGQRAILQGGNDPWGDLSSDTAVDFNVNTCVTERISGITTRIAIAPHPRVTAEYIEVVAPVVALAFREMQLNPGPTFAGRKLDQNKCFLL
jgi:hypothetical protein